MKEMAEPICRVLRDGALEGEHAPALMIKDSMHSAFGLDVFNHILCSLASNISAGKSQARGLVLVSLNRHPSFYTDLLKSRGIGVASSNKLIQIVDCYSDPLGWKDRLLDPGCITKLSPKATGTLCKDIRDLDKLLSVAIDLVTMFVAA
uniref:Elongator complex protein 5 n=1 Tax=Nelumbo nucifera TaxID=4432 RepID=A0A822YMH6_NELNU|nr:TPA_asm: hypothetical protein HUJ06_006024 [Nelumbo nucifera]